jgi:hypothetical protein
VLAAVNRRADYRAGPRAYSRADRSRNDGTRSRADERTCSGIALASRHETDRHSCRNTNEDQVLHTKGSSALAFMRLSNWRAAQAESRMFAPAAASNIRR